jgi:hypothetical protein
LENRHNIKFSNQRYYILSKLLKTGTGKKKFRELLIKIQNRRYMKYEPLFWKNWRAFHWQRIQLKIRLEVQGWLAGKVWLQIELT